MNKKILILLIVVIVGIFIYSFYKRMKNKKVFKDIGFGDFVISKLTNSELSAAVEYLKNYTRKGVKLTSENNPGLYKKITEINKKTKLFYNI
jgi:uncharacterized protein (UPF0333 family)